MLELFDSLDNSKEVIDKNENLFYKILNNKYISYITNV